MRLAHLPAAACAAALLLALPAVASAQGTVGEGENIRHVKNIAYPDLQPSEPGVRDRDEENAGTDIEFARIRGHRYAIAGSYSDGMQIIYIQNPGKSSQTRLVGTWKCGMSQADPQVFRRKDMPGRVFVTSTMDDGYTFHADSSTCDEELAAKGIDVGNGYGTFIADITNPRKPRTVGFIPFSVDGPAIFSEGASHNGTVHPSGKYFYNSDSDLIDSVLNEPPAIEVFDISNFAKPELVDKIKLKTVPGLGTESHDITFNKAGTRAYSAALSHAAIIDTSNPRKNKNIGTIIDPAINVWHQSDPVTIKDPILGKRDFLLVEDEVAGALGTGQCPNGGVHVYDITGDLERNPVKVGYWNIDDVDTTDDLLSCTAHVFDIHEREQLMTIAYYNGGVRVVDLSGLVGVALGRTGVGMKELGYYRFTGGDDYSDTWAVKAPYARRSGFYLYGNDQNRGFDSYYYKPDQATLKGSRSTWMTPAEQLLAAKQYRAQFGDPKLAALCLLNAKPQAALEQAAEGADLSLATGTAFGS